MIHRPLTAADAQPLEAFLAEHRDTSMFMRSNARRAGLEYHGAPFEAHYMGAFRDGRLVSAVAHGWNGVVQLQAPLDTAELARACVALSGRTVEGITGPTDQVRTARVALGLEAVKASLEGDERFYVLGLRDLRIPTALATGQLVCRAPLPEERGLLVAWRMAYDLEVLGARDTPEQRRRSASFLDGQIADGHAWVAVVDGQPVSLAAFNAALPDIVQLGGIYTPPELRGRGYAKAACAAALMWARDRDVARAVLFTANPNAERTYGALGFERSGDYSLILFR